MILKEDNPNVVSEKRHTYVLLTEGKESIMVVLNKDSKEVVFMKTLNKGENLGFQANAPLQESVDFISCSANYTLVPREFSSKENKESLSQFNFNTKLGFEIFEDLTYDKRISILFEENFSELVNFSDFPTAELHHFARTIMLFVSKIQQDNLALIILNDTLFVTLQIKQQIHLSNAFEVKNMEEVLYYTMLVIQEFQVDPTTIIINHAGDFEKESSLQKELSLYFLNVHAIQLSSFEDARYSGIIKLLSA